MTVGDNNDLFITHTNNGLIDNNTGDLTIQTQNVMQLKTADAELGIQLVKNGGAELYYDNSKKLETTSIGVTVTGKITATDEIISQDDIRIQSAYPRLYLTDSDNNDDFSLINNNGNFLIYNDTAGAYRIKVDGANTFFTTNLRPATDSLYNVGSTSLRWANVYADTYHGDGSNLTGINTDLVSDTSPQLGGNLDTNSFEIDLDDGHAVRFGNGNYMHVYHTGSAGYVTNNTGNMIIQSNAFRVYNGNGSHDMIQANNGGAVNLYYDNSKKFETTSLGAQITGRLNVSGNFEQDDNVKANWGNSHDLQIYHDGSDSYINDAGTGNLYIVGTDGNINLQTNGSENAVKCIENGAVELYYDNVRKFRTYSAGVIADDNLWVGTDNKKLLVGGSGDFEIFHNTHNYVNFKNGALIFQNNGTNVAYFHDSDSHFLPWSSNTFDLGSSGNRWRNVYTNDLHLSNEGHTNDVDGSWGDWTIQEGESDLFLKNNRSGKKYKFNLTEVS